VGTVANEVKKSVRRFHAAGSDDEVAALRLIVQEVVAQMDQLATLDASGAVPEQFGQEELGRAAHEDAAVEAAMHRAAPDHGVTTVPLCRSRERTAVDQATATTLKKRIEYGELIGSGVLQRALNVQRQALSAAMKAGRLFAFVGPSGENYYPAFYVDPTLDRRDVEKVSKALGELPAASKYYFFTEPFTVLRDTPLGALRKGRVSEVVAAAASVVCR
jgi:hypothetical protein